MTLLDAVLLFFTGVAAAALNSIAGGGSFLTVPALIFIGADPVRANATSTLALWPAWFATSAAMRGELHAERRTMWLLGIPGVIGGIVGAVVLVRTPSALFVQLLPFLLLVATLLFAFGDRLRRAFGEYPSGAPSRARQGVMIVFQIFIALYGGYFGGGMGFLLLALMSMHGLTDIHRMNAVKSVLGIVINGVALMTFVLARSIDWMPGLVMAAGGMVGGYTGPLLARRVPQVLLRRIVILIGFLMTAIFFARAFRS